MQIKLFIFNKKYWVLSHGNQRKNNNCLNCNAVVENRFCSVCGQENIEPAEGIGHFVFHFFNDITHFDSKFFSTLKKLLFSPGALSAAYRQGQRVSFLNPIRMYLFSSFLFFLVFFASVNFSNAIKIDTIEPFEIEQVDSAASAKFLNKTKQELPKSKAESKKRPDKQKQDFRLSEYENSTVYDSLLKTGTLEHGWLRQRFERKKMLISEKYKGDQVSFLKVMVDVFMHSFPQMLFVSLPLFAFGLQLLYWRRKEYYYVSHAIFTIHYYIFILAVLLITIGFSKVFEFLNLRWPDILGSLISLMIFFYLYKAMRRFYNQGRGITIVKFLLLLFWLLIITGVLTSIFILFSFFKI